MSSENLIRAVEQHVAIDAFLTGDFLIKGEIAAPAEVESEGVQTVDKRTRLCAIAAEVQKCCKCELGGLRTNAVVGEGNPDAQIVFVGEAPGADEDQQGRPFVGRAGKLLTNIIAAMGLSRDDVFICNILKCRPPGNRDPKPDEIINCLPYLQKQLGVIRPEVIIALGAHAARTLLNTNQAIGKLRGRFHEYKFSEEEPPIKLMATYHPAYLLRNYSPDNRRKVWDDMKKVLIELGMDVPEPKKKKS